MAGTDKTFTDDPKAKDLLNNNDLKLFDSLNLSQNNDKFGSCIQSVKYSAYQSTFGW